MWDWLKDLGKYRDGLIIVTVGIYILGYIVKSIYSLRLNLGVLPLLDAQYTVAGLVPASIILIIIFLGLPVEKLPFQNIIVKLVNRHAIMIRVTIYTLYTLVFLLLYFRIPKSHFISLQDDLLTVALFSSMMVLCIFLIFFHKFYKSSTFTVGLPFFILISLTWLYIYAIQIYPIVPQALGGIRSRCAYLNLDRNEISRTTLTDLTIKSVSFRKTSIEELKRQKVPDNILQKLNQMLDKEFSSSKEFYADLLNLIGKDDVKKYMELIVENLELKYFDSDDDIILSSEIELIYSDDNKVVVLQPIIGRLYEIEREVIPAIVFCD